jgi:hypothetical protein
MKYWEIVADRLHAEGWSYGIAEHLTKHGLLFCVDAHRDGKRFIVKGDDLLTAVSFAGERRDSVKRRYRREAVMLSQLATRKTYKALVIDDFFTNAIRCDRDWL